jgi:hypothetical protein
MKHKTASSAKILKAETKLCFSCMEEHVVQEVTVSEENIFNGKIVHYNAIYEYCSKADEYTQTEDMIRNNDVAFKDAYKKQMNLINKKGV